MQSGSSGTARPPPSGSTYQRSSHRMPKGSAFERRIAAAMSNVKGPSRTQRWLAGQDGSRRCVNATVVAVRHQGRCVGYAALAHEVPSATPADGRSNALSNSLAARVEDTARRLSESNALLATEIVDRTQAEAARMRLLRRLVVAQEEERRRIARDLHDDLGQRLTALRLTLEALDASARDGRDVVDRGIGHALEHAGTDRREPRLPGVGAETGRAG